MKIGPAYPEKESPDMAGSRSRLEKQKEDLISARAEIGRLADLARRKDRVELGRVNRTEGSSDIYSRRELEKTSGKADNKESATLSEQRRQAILERIESGFYDSDEVKSRIIDKMLGDKDANSIEE